MASVSEYKNKAVEYIKKMSGRERAMVGAVVVGAAIFVLYIALIQPVTEAFASQTTELGQAQMEIKTVAVMLENYKKLKAKREEIENEYRGIEIKEGGLTLIETLIRNRMDPPPGTFVIKEREDGTKSFGGNYEQSMYNVQRLYVTDLGKFVGFLQELVHGPKPLILKRLDMRKRNDRVEVDLDVASIRRVKG